jgi:hypothetical protein
MTDQHEQQRINEAAEQFTDALAHSYKTLAERGVEAVEQGTKVMEVLFNRSINNLHVQAEENRRATQQLAEHQQRQAEAAQSVAQESVGAYVEFVGSIFSYWQGGIQAAEEGTREAEKKAAKEGQGSFKEELRRLIKESVRRSEAGLGGEPQEGGATVAPDGDRAAGEGPPLEDYDSLNVEQISNRLEGLSVEELEQLRRYEAANKDRSTLRRRIDDLIASRNT